MIAGFRAEQQERHAWLKTQQANDHQLNVASQKQSFLRNVIGTVSAPLIVLTMIGCGTMLILKGASASGIAFLVIAVAGLVGTALWGHKAQKLNFAKESREFELPAQT